MKTLAVLISLIIPIFAFSEDSKSISIKNKWVRLEQNDSSKFDEYRLNFDTTGMTLKATSNEVTGKLVVITRQVSCDYVFSENLGLDGNTGEIDAYLIPNAEMKSECEESYRFSYEVKVNYLIIKNSLLRGLFTLSRI